VKVTVPTLATEKRLLQIVVAVACLVPLLAGGSGVLRGAEMMHGVGARPPVDLDSHFRYLSGLLLGMGLAFVWCIPAIERRTVLFRALGLLAIVGGFSRLLGLILNGVPGPGHVFGLFMELGTVPLLILWQARVARRLASALPDRP
jgi:Domain of unknown function (DUF4345)